MSTTRKTARRAALTLALVLSAGAPLRAQSDTEDTEPAAPSAAVEAEDEAAATATEEAAEPETPSAFEFFRALGRILTGSSGADAYAQEDEVPSPLLGQPAPEFELPTPDGQTIKLTDLRGKTVVLDFWATWCGPCVMAMPKLEQLNNEIAGEEVAIVGVNVGEDADTVREFIENRGFTFPQALDAQGETSNAFGVSSIPQTVVIDAQGMIQAIHVGYSPTLGATLRSEVERLQAGERLFDAETIAKAKARRQERLEAVQSKVGPVSADRLEEVAKWDVGDNAYFDAAGGNGWVHAPGVDAPCLAVSVGAGRIALIRPDGVPPKVVELDWGGGDEALELSGFHALVDDGALHWLACGTSYTDDYATEALHLGLFDSKGAREWAVRLPVVGENYANVSAAVGDLTGDGEPEVAALAEYYGVVDESGAEGYLHVLSIYTVGGELVSRTWHDGEDGTAVYILPHVEGPRVILNVDSAAVAFRLKESQEPSDPSL